MELRGTNKREIERIEKKDDIFSGKIRKAEIIINLIFDDCFCFEFGGFLSNK